MLVSKCIRVHRCSLFSNHKPNTIVSNLHNETTQKNQSTDNQNNNITECNRSFKEGKRLINGQFQHHVTFWVMDVTCKLLENVFTLIYLFILYFTKVLMIEFRHITLCTVFPFKRENNACSMDKRCNESQTRKKNGEKMGSILVVIVKYRFMI